MVSSNLNRRQFLTIGRNRETHPVRPPWAIDENAFQNACTRCGDCISICPEKILIHEGANGFPQVDFKRGECSFCSDCVQACPTAALNISQPSPWSIKANVDNSCLAAHQVLCMSCADQCDVRAIRFIPVAGAVSQPEINLDDCTGCGACVASCPSQSIEVKYAG